MNRKKILLVFLFFSLVVGVASAAGSPPDPGAAPTVSALRDYTLRLGEFAFDPLVGEPQLPDGWDRSAAVGPDLHLVQFDGPIPDGALDALREGGLEPVQYIHPGTYIVWGRHEARTSIRHRSIRWTGDFAPAYRVQPEWRDLPADPVGVKALIYRGADPDAVVARITALGAALTTRRGVNDKLEVAGFNIPGDRIQEASAIAGVYSIQLLSTDGGPRGEIGAQINAGNVDGSSLAYPGYATWLSGVGLDGSGVIVAHVDDGADETHPDLAAQILPCTGATCAGWRGAHGTHTAGIIVGDGSSATLDANGFNRGLGVAPGANLIRQIYAPVMNGMVDMLAPMADSVNNGASVSNNSWGPSVVAHGYNVDTLLVDAGVRDADLDTPGSQPLIYVQAIDNGNGGTSTQGTPDDAKNIITVGSTYAVAPDGDPDNRINRLSENTAHGPALDGRVIPHLVAPGCLVDSTVPGQTEGEAVYGKQCGTSMAAPQVAGAAALFIEHYRGLPEFEADPSPALVKAALLPVAHDLEGFPDADGGTMGHRPDAKQGWGRLNLSAVVDSPAGSVLYFDQPTVLDFTGQEWMRVVSAVDPGQPLRVMLAWTDAPGHGLGGNTPAWNNDLDLVVDADAQTYLGNVFGIDGFSATGGVADAMNNAEGVFLPTVSGDVTLRVTAADINSNGVPYVGDDTDQDFAVVCYNCALVPDFALSPDTGTVGVCAPESGPIVINVEQLAGFGDPVTLSVTGVPAGASVGFTPNPVTPGATSVLTLDPGTAVDGDYILDVQGDSATLSRSVAVKLELRTGAPVPAVLTLPLDAAIDVHPQAVLGWDAVPLIAHYMVEIATDPDFLQIVYSALEEGTSHTVGVTLAQETAYYWRVRATNTCGFGGVSLASSFTTIDVPDLLLVDDDYDIPNEQNEYTQALNSLGVSYDVWDVWDPPVHEHDEPGPRDLAPYDHVIWWTGQEENYAGPDADSEVVLADWLDNAGCLMISSADYVLNSTDFSTFITERMGVDSASEDTGQNTVTGQGTVYAGLGPYSLSSLNPDYRDSLTPDGTAELAFSGDLGDAAVAKDGGAYRTSFLGFGVESTGTSAKPEILNAFLTWCAGLPDVDGDSDGWLNGVDCAPADPDAWTAPSPITDLMLGKGAVGFSWSQPISGSGAVYDVLRTENPADFYNATCVAAGVTQTSASPDEENPAPGEMFFYLVGASNDCGLSTLGTNLDSSPRYGTACDRSKVWW